MPPPSPMLLGPASPTWLPSSSSRSSSLQPDALPSPAAASDLVTRADLHALVAELQLLQSLSRAPPSVPDETLAALRTALAATVALQQSALPLQPSSSTSSHITTDVMSVSQTASSQPMATVSSVDASVQTDPPPEGAVAGCPQCAVGAAAVGAVEAELRAATLQLLDARSSIIQLQVK